VRAVVCFLTFSSRLYVHVYVWEFVDMSNGPPIFGAGEMISVVCARRWIHESALIVRRPVECAILHRFLV